MSGSFFSVLETSATRYISEPELCTDLEKVWENVFFSEQFRNLINRCKRVGYNLDIMRQSACLVVNPIMVRFRKSMGKCIFFGTIQKSY